MPCNASHKLRVNEAIVAMVEVVKSLPQRIITWVELNQPTEYVERIIVGAL